MAYEINNLKSDDLGARFSMDFSKNEVKVFLEKLGYIVKSINGPSRQRIDSMYDDHAIFAELYLEALVALKPGQEPPIRLDDHEAMWNVSIQQVFLYEMRKKLLAL